MYKCTSTPHEDRDDSGAVFSQHRWAFLRNVELNDFIFEMFVIQYSLQILSENDKLDSEYV